MAAIEDSALLELYGDDAELIADMLKLYLEKRGVPLQQLTAALSSGVAAEVQLAAHRIKSVFSSIGAKGGFELAQAMERHAAGGDVTAAQALMPPLLESVAAVDADAKARTT